MIVGFLAGLVWGAALILVCLGICIRTIKQGKIFHFVLGYARSAPNEERVHLFAILRSRYCEYCGLEQEMPSLCRCHGATARREFEGIIVDHLERVRRESAS